MNIADDSFWPVRRNKFGTGEPKLEEIHCPQSSSRKCEYASESHESQIVVGNRFFGGLMPFFYGLGVGFVVVIGGGILAWRLWGV